MSQQKESYKKYEDLVLLIKKSNIRDYNMELIDKAYCFALKAHGEQKRYSGVPYISHPISVAYILVEWGMDTESIVAALLHDIVEDTDVDLKCIQKQFGPVIANLVSGITKIGKIPLSTKEEQQAENLRKMLIAMASDIRVIIIKLADRLNNMRTIGCLPKQKCRETARETMEIYAPIAHRLGMRAVKEELEDISIRCLDPFAYQEIEDVLNMRKSAREEFICSIRKKLSKRLFQVIPNVHIEGRVKSINGIYRKVYMQNRHIEEVYDVYAVRIIVDTESDCYNVLGIVHDLFHPIPNRFKDYISTPKPNFYRSLHSTVISKEGIPFEVQIRNWEMHYTSEYGIAAHWKYKLGLSKNKDPLEQRLVWIRRMIENQFDSQDFTDIVSTIKTDLKQEEVYVFTPKGDVISLPVGSTVIDFAYAIHSAIGNKIVGAKVNKKMVPIDSIIKNGEIIEVLTSKEDKGPNRDWLKLVCTSEARSKIRQWFKKEKKEENILEGKKEIEREFRKNNIKFADEKQLQEFLKIIAKKQRCSSIEHFFESIGYGGIRLERLMSKIREDYAKLQKNDDKKIKETPILVDEVQPKSGVIIDGIDNCLVKFSKCCNPLPGDDIIGFVTRSYGVAIHNRSCINVQWDLINDVADGRWIDAWWEEGVKREFKLDLTMLVNNREGILTKITLKLSEMHIFIHSINTKNLANEQALIYFTITVHSLKHFQLIVNKLNTIDGVIYVKRH
ncbi:MAG: bifunctional (p)ppGpp synthetase/guanosine-3',5'-bis(diphosphate) 3'-pyrophosphohydrolase [Oscillospiraceae bacterium]|jgi:GTP pyrophosphokinase|nr:bifunctional (p)ppGpp synthetase/guanosine-3',5'-bis(diphosphate) 3'-pyrophosphohydrolase [Oscillospiraceae bacterium]